jgi:hypothetical protein
VLPSVTLRLLVGPVIAVPAPAFLTDSFQSAEVTHADEGRSGFQLHFKLDRSGPLGAIDYPVLVSQLLRPFNRVIIVVTVNAIPRVLMDGVITNHQLTPSNEPGATTLAVTGEDVSMMMDLEEKAVLHPAQDETIIALKLIAMYALYGLIPIVLPPGLIDFPVPTERMPAQNGTDLAYLKAMAARHGYVFQVIPGAVPFTNFAYWGPAIRLGIPQRALTVNMGPASNVDSLSFQYNALAPLSVTGMIQDSLTNLTLPVRTFFSTRPPLETMPALPFQLPNVKTAQLQNAQGLNIIQAFARAQAQTDASLTDVVTGTGTLDAARYGELLMPRLLVGVRGAGYSYDGMYYVKKVTHSVAQGKYTQNFTITRQGTGALTPVVVP